MGGIMELDENEKSTAPAPESDRVRELERHLRDQQREVFNLQAELSKAKNAKPSSPAGDSTKELDWLKREKEDLERDVKDLESQIDRLEKENSELRNAARDKSAAGPALEKLTKERDRLKTELDRLKKGIAESLPPITADFSHLGKATEAEKDDLTRINGIGPVVEQKLNQLGIYTYGQVSRLTPADMDLIDQVLQLFPGRVARENWVGQASEKLKDNS
jgi:predicted flap endonuclease-1-like 5' DNA nuclease